MINYGGPVLASPKIVPVFFAGDDATLVAQIADFDSKIGGTQYWAAATGEYGVGPATASAPVYLTEAAPSNIDDAVIQTWLAGKLNGDDPAWPVSDANTVYVLHYPDSTTVTLGGASSCQSFGGYHANITLDASHGNADTAYAVIPRCTGFNGMNLLDSETGSESHELIEAATDPYPYTNPAYAEVDDDHIYWSLVLGGGEVGDMCAQFSGAFTTFPELPQYVVQRSWSNAAAVAGHDPCVPALAGEVYFNAAPELPDTVSYRFAGQALSIPGVSIPVGSSRTIDLDLFSDAATSGPWTVQALDFHSATGGAPYLSLSLNQDTGSNGTRLQLTITVNSAPSRQAEYFMLKSSLNGQTSYWFGLVTN